MMNKLDSAERRIAPRRIKTSPARLMHNALANFRVFGLQAAMRLLLKAGFSETAARAVLAAGRERRRSSSRQSNDQTE